MKFRIFALMFIGSCLVTAGCVFLDSRLNIAYEPVVAEKGELSSLPSLRLKMESFEDKRSESVIAYKNLMETSEVSSKKPMPEVIQEALTVLFKINGHQINVSNPQLTMSGEVMLVDMSFLPGVMTTEAIGKINIRLYVKAPNEKVIFTREYQGEHHQKTALATMKIWEHVFNVALKDLMHNLGTDKSLHEVFLAQAE